jgi:YYY domain-containing protein
LGSIPLNAAQEYYLFTQATAGAPIRLDTTVIANEYPDDSLPTRVDGRDPFGGMYRGLESAGDGKTHWDLNEDASKLSQALEWLDEADVIALSSNRGYASIPRLPARYPLAIEYYRALFAEELGFELIATFTSYPAIGPFQFPDQETPFPPGEPSLLRDELRTISVGLPPAEEAFSVYDHPQVFLFHKTAEYSRQHVEQILGSVDLSQVVWMKPTEATLAPTALMLTQDELVQQRSGGTWTDIFDAGDWLNRSPLLSVIVWWMLIQVLGLIAFPLLFVVAPGLRDRGWPLAKTLALLLLATLVWLGASTHLVTYSRPVILVALLLLAILGGALAWWQRRELIAWVARERRSILVGELLFNAMFLLFLLIRYGNPDLWHPAMGGERPMDFAYLNAVIKSTYFPPYDPWFSGGYMNYYYFGFVLVGTPIKLLGILPEIAYNLVLPTFFALTGAGAYSVAYNLVASRQPRPHTGPSTDQLTNQPPHNTQYATRLTRHALYAGLIAALFVAVLGNLGEINLLVDGWHELGSRDFEFESTIPGLEPLVVTTRGLIKNTVGGEPMPWRPEWPYWNASRAIPHPGTEAPPITEFPFFTFLYSDLHAHLLVLPLTLLALGWIVNWTLDAGFWSLESRRRWFSALLGLVIGGLIIGSLRPTNTWDYVTYLAFLPLALTIGYYVHQVSGQDRQLDLAAVRGGVAAIGGRFVVVATFSYLLFLPFISRYATASTGFELWKGSRTPLWAYFGVHGLFLFPILTWLLLPLLSSALGSVTRRKETPEEAWVWRQIRAMSAQSSGVSSSRVFLSIIPLALAMITLLAVAMGYQVALVVLPFGFLSLLFVIGRKVAPAQRLVALMIGIGLALTFMVEILVLNQGDVSRMNTVFKFYLQVWVLFGIAAAVCLVWLFRRFGGDVTPSVRSEVNTPHPSTDSSLKDSPPTDPSAPSQVSAPDPSSGSAPAESSSPKEHVNTAHSPRARYAWRVWQAVLVLLIALAALYPILATRAKINDRWARQIGPGLDSLEWIKAVSDTQYSPATPEGYRFPLLWDYQALMWLRENVHGSPVVAEGAKAPPYRSLRARVATYTGLPIIIGYPWHQKQQRSFLKNDVIGQRERDVDNLYDSSDPWLAKEILDRYDVSLVYVGDLERIYYAPAGIAKFAKMAEMGLLRPVYANEGVTIYDVIR